jgi:hypothetical protein
MRLINTLMILVFGISFCLAQTSAPTASITLSNPSVFPRKGEVVEIPWTTLKSKVPNLDTANFKLIHTVTKKEAPVQFETKGGSSIVNMLLQVDFTALGTVKLIIVSGKRSPVPIKTFGRYVPERKDDFAWENDKIAFRMYGKELEKTPKEMAYGTDVWVKSTDRMVINERYKRGRYHENLGDGMDYYHVGLTLGAGNIAPYLKDSIWYDGTYASWKVLDNGPLRTSFQLSYNEWKAGDFKLKVTKTITLDAGSYFNRVEAKYDGQGNADLPVVMGIVKRNDPGVMVLDEQRSVMAYWEPLHGGDGIMGLATFTASPVSKMNVSPLQLLSHAKIPTGSTGFVYYNGACWNMAGEFTDAAAWFNHVQMSRTRITEKISVSIQ